MHCTLSVVVFAAVLAGLNAAVADSPLRANLNVGSVGPYDRLLASQHMFLLAANTIQVQDFVYRGNNKTYITSVQATEQGVKQGASTRITYGGLGRNNVTIRFQSVPRKGFNYLVAVWGR